MRSDAQQRELCVERLQGELMTCATPTGGWAYYPGKASRLEPTCWAMLALASSSNQRQTVSALAMDAHLTFLSQCQQPNGLLADVATSPNLASNGLAALLCLMLGGDRSNAMLARLIP